MTKFDGYSPKQIYNLKPYAEDDIVDALKKKTQNSAPGDDKILHAYLTKLPSIHKLLATLFTLIQYTVGDPADLEISRNFLIPKSDKVNTENSSDFRMIALTANVAKLYHT